MRVFIEAWHRALALLRRRRLEHDLDEEVAFHLAMREQENIRAGASPATVGATARRQFGNVTHLKEQMRDAWTFQWVESVCQDLRFAGRSLRKAPGFAAAAILTLALGIGANTAIFSVVNAVLLRPLPYPNADRIVVLGYTFLGAWVPWASETKFNVWRHHAPTFQDLSAVRMGHVDLRDRFGSEHVAAGWITGDFFRLLGAPAGQGRLLSEDDDRPDSDRVVVLSDAYQQRRFGGNRDGLGQRLWIDGDVYVVIGVLGTAFDSAIFSVSPDVWIPLRLDPNSTSHPPSIRAIARLAPGVSLESANADARRAGTEFGRLFPEATSSNDTFVVAPFRDVMVGSVRSSLFVFMGAVTLVLLIACANVGSLILARANGRQREIAIRTSLGAGRGRVIRQLLTESLVLALVGGALGLILGTVGIRSVLALNPSGLPRLGPQNASVSPDWRVFAFTVVVSGITAVACGMWPAARLTGNNLTESLNARGRPSRNAESLTRRWLVAVELALALVLVIGAALLIRTFIALRTVDRGFESHQVLTVRMSLTDPRFATTPAVAQLVRDGTEHVRALPDVISVAAAASLPLQSDWLTSFQIAGRPTLPSPGLASERIIAQHYFDVFGIRVISGRAFTDDDRGGALPVAIVNATMARQFWPDRNPIDDRLVLFPGFVPEDDPPRQIVGIVTDVRDGLPLNVAPRPTVYVPLAQVSDRLLHAEPLAWIIRAQAPTAVIRAVEQGLERISGGLATSNVRSMDAIIAESAAPTWFITVLLMTFGGSALLLAAIGVYGLMAYSVTQRTHEIGIRVALGAPRSDVIGLVLRQGAAMTAVGIVLGLVGAAVVTRYLEGMLFDLTPLDPTTFIAVSLMFAAVATLASYVPARRATKVDPIVALRCE